MNAIAEFDSLSGREEFRARHIAPSAAEQAAMLAALGLPDRETLIARTVPDAIRLTRRMAIPPRARRRRFLPSSRRWPPRTAPTSRA